MKKKTQKISKKRVISAEDLFKLRIPISISMAPDESKIAYTVERMDKKENKYFSNIFIYDLKEAGTTQFTFGDHSDGSAAWSPDGSKIVFLSTRDKKTGLYIMPVSGGAEQKLIEIDGAISNINWVENGKSLVFMCCQVMLNTVRKTKIWVYLLLME